MRRSWGLGQADDEGPNGPRWGLVQTVTAMLLASLLTMPPAGAFHGSIGGAIQECRDGWTGLQVGDDGPHVCTRFTVDLPDLDSKDIPTPETINCPGEDFDGHIVTAGGTAVGVCAKVVYQIPTIWPNIPQWRVNTAECELQDDEWNRDGADPVIEINDGGVAFCVVPIVEPDAPDVFISTDPCEPRTVDPEVRVAGARAEICLDFEVAGVSSDDFNDEIQRANRTVHAALTLVP